MPKIGTVPMSFATWSRLVSRTLSSTGPRDVRATSRMAASTVSPTTNEAVMMAVRLARAHAKRLKILKFQGHFHGWSDTMTASFRAPFNVPSSVGIDSAALESVIVAPADLEEVERIFSEQPDDIACAIVEPTGASYGTIPLPEGFLAGLKEAAHRLHS